MASSQQDQKPDTQPTEAETRRARLVLGIVCGLLILAGVVYTGSGMLGLRGTAGDTQVPAHPLLPTGSAPGHAPAPAPAAVPSSAPAPAPAGK